MAPDVDRLVVPLDSGTQDQTPCVVTNAVPSAHKPIEVLAKLELFPSSNAWPLIFELLRVERFPNSFFIEHRCLLFSVLVLQLRVLISILSHISCSNIHCN